MPSHPRGRNATVWGGNSLDAARYSSLQADANADVCVIGAGIAGLTTAYMLAREGKSVVVLDDGPIGGGETSFTTAHLSNALDDRYYELERLHGSDGAQLAAQSHAAAIDTIEAIVQNESISCDFARLNGFLCSPPTEDREELEEEWQAARRAGVSVEWAERAPIEHFNTGPCLRFPQQGQLHPLKYLHGLVQAIERRGGKIFCATHAQDVQAGSPVRVHTSNGPQVIANTVVIATNAPISETYGLYAANAPYRTYAIAVRVSRGTVTRALYWDTPDPYHYVRLQRSEEHKDVDWLIVGGEDHKTGQANDFEERFERLESWTRERLPKFDSVAFRWSG